MDLQSWQYFIVQRFFHCSDQSSCSFWLAVAAQRPEQHVLPRQHGQQRHRDHHRSVDAAVRFSSTFFSFLHPSRLSFPFGCAGEKRKIPEALTLEDAKRIRVMGDIPMELVNEVMMTITDPAAMLGPEARL